MTAILLWLVSFHLFGQDTYSCLNLSHRGDYPRSCIEIDKAKAATDHFLRTKKTCARKKEKWLHRPCPSANQVGQCHHLLYGKSKGSQLINYYKPGKVSESDIKSSNSILKYKCGGYNKLVYSQSVISESPSERGNFSQRRSTGRCLIYKSKKNKEIFSCIEYGKQKKGGWKPKVSCMMNGVGKRSPAFSTKIRKCPRKGLQGACRHEDRTEFKYQTYGVNTQSTLKFNCDNGEYYSIDQILAK